jgi:predicted permease
MTTQVNDILANIAYASRTVFRVIATSFFTILVLAVGIGVSTAIYALAEPFIARPVPYPNSGELVNITFGAAGLSKVTVIPTLDDIRHRTELLKDVAAHRPGVTLRVQAGSGSVFVTTREVSENFFNVLGFHGVSTRGWRESLSGTTTPIVLTATGVKHLQADKRFTHNNLRQEDGSVLAVNGATPDHFLYPAAGVLIVHGMTPLRPGPVLQVHRWREDGTASATPLTLIGRLQDGITPAALRAALEHGGPSGSTLGVRVTTLGEELTRSMRPLAVGSVCAGVLILVVCAGNVANLFVARTAHRARELYTRRVLGASSLHLGTVIAAELGVLTIVATSGGLALASVILHVGLRHAPPEYLTLGTPSVTLSVVSVATGSVLLIMAFAAIPTLCALRRLSLWTFNEQVASVDRSLKAVRLFALATQSALAVILAMGAVLLIRSYMNLVMQDPGFNRNALTATVSYPLKLKGMASYETISRTIEQLKRVPGVHNAAATTGPMVEGVMSITSRNGLTTDGKDIVVDGKAVTPEFFEVVGMHVTSGKVFSSRDDGRHVIVVNESMVKEYWPRTNPVGKTVLFGTRPIQVIGVVRDAFDRALDTKPSPTMFMVLQEMSGGVITYVLETTEGASVSMERVRVALTAVYRDTVVVDMDTLGDRLSDTVRDRSFATVVLTLCAGATVMVSMLGLAGVVAFSIAERRRELAIRIALGAPGGHLHYLVLREAGLAAIFGAFCGLLTSRWLGVGLEGLIYGVSPGSWTMAFGAISVVLAVMLLSCLVYMRRVFRLQPYDILRAQ